MARQDGKLVEIEIVAPVRTEGETHQVFEMVDRHPDQPVAETLAQPVLRDGLARLAQRSEIDQAGSAEQRGRGQIDVLEFADFIAARRPHPVLRRGFRNEGRHGEGRQPGASLVWVYRYAT